jgi:hypothetical protein
MEAAKQGDELAVFSHMREAEAYFQGAILDVLGTGWAPGARAQVIAAKVTLTQMRAALGQTGQILRERRIRDAAHSASNARQLHRQLLAEQRAGLWERTRALGRDPRLEYASVTMMEGLSRTDTSRPDSRSRIVPSPTHKQPAPTRG